MAVCQLLDRIAQQEAIPLRSHYVPNKTLLGSQIVIHLPGKKITISLYKLRLVLQYPNTVSKSPRIDLALDKINLHVPTLQIDLLILHLCVGIIAIQYGFPLLQIYPDGILCLVSNPRRKLPDDF